MPLPGWCTSGIVEVLLLCFLVGSEGGSLQGGADQSVASQSSAFSFWAAKLRMSLFSTLGGLCRFFVRRGRNIVMVLLFLPICFQFPADPEGEKASLPPPGGAVGCGEDETSASLSKEGGGGIQSPQSTSASSSEVLSVVLWICDPSFGGSTGAAFESLLMCFLFPFFR